MNSKLKIVIYFFFMGKTNQQRCMHLIEGDFGEPSHLMKEWLPEDITICRG